MLTATRVGDPFTLGPFAAAFYQVTLDTSYPAGGESLTAAVVGMQSLVAVIPASGASGTTGAGALPRVSVQPNKLSALVQVFVSGTGGAYAQNDSLVEDNTVNQSGFITLLLVLGHA